MKAPRRLAVGGSTTQPEQYVQDLTRLQDSFNVETFDQLLTRVAKRRLKEYDDCATRGGHQAGDELMVDMMNNVGFGSISTNMPAITQANDPWSLTLRRPALLEERFEAQGFPMVFPSRRQGWIAHSTCVILGSQERKLRHWRGMPCLFLRWRWWCPTCSC